MYDISITNMFWDTMTWQDGITTQNAFLWRNNFFYPQAVQNIVLPITLRCSPGNWLMRSFNGTFFTSNAPLVLYLLLVCFRLRSLAMWAGVLLVVSQSCSTPFCCLWKRELGPTQSLLLVCAVLQTKNDAVLRYPSSPSPRRMKIDWTMDRTWK